jgi:galactose mutarotase-like enzyme
MSRKNLLNQITLGYLSEKQAFEVKLTEGYPIHLGVHKYFNLRRESLNVSTS